MGDVENVSLRVYEYIPAYVLAGLIKGKDENSVNQLSVTVAATSEKTIDFIFKAPTVGIIKRSLEDGG